MFRRRLGFERLEGRELLAGDVVASVSGSTLTITGGSGTEEIRVVHLGDSLEVRSLISSTTINGQAEAIFPANVQNIVVSGIVSVGLFYVDVSGDVTVQSSGCSRVNVHGSIGGNLSIDTSGDSCGDVVTLFGTFNNISLQTGDGSDILYSDGFTSLGNVSIDLGDGNDYLWISERSRFEFHQDVYVHLGAGDDTVNCGEDSISWWYNPGNGNVMIDGGTGFDEMTGDQNVATAFTPGFQNFKNNYSETRFMIGPERAILSRLV